MADDIGLQGAALRAGAWAALIAASALLGTADGAANGTARDTLFAPPFECGSQLPEQWLESVRAAVARGEIVDPATQVIPPIRPGPRRRGTGAMRSLSPEHVFAFEDTNQILLSDFSNGQLIALMVSAANELMATHGDLYDFIGYWLNFTPHHTVGWAFYLTLENDVTGIGRELLNNRAAYGVGGENLEGFIMVWNINRAGIEPGDGPEAEGTRTTLGHEFEHRFAMYLPDLLDGRRMQGYGGFGCYDAGHPNPAVDSQGSALGIGEWVGSSPAVLQASYPDFYLFNSDTGGLYSYTELYLMGYVSPTEMDAGNSELRYMDEWDCVVSDYYGPISTFSSADVIDAAGPRVPDSEEEDKHYRTGWIMLHRPGDPPDSTELAKAVAIHEQQQIDWYLSTLGRGTMDNSLFDDPTSAPPTFDSPSESLLFSAWPNPGREGTQARFTLVEPARVELQVYDVRGRVVRTLVDGIRGAGDHVVTWHGLDDSGARVSSGTYFLKFSNGSEVRTERVTRIR
jgi:hypothetical protein